MKYRYLIIIALIGFIVQRLGLIFDAYESHVDVDLSANNNKCKLYHEKEVESEDIVYIGQGKYIVTKHDMLELLNDIPKNIKSVGKLFVMDLELSNYPITEIILENFDVNSNGFVPHGIDYKDNNLYVINHGKEFEEILVFKLMENLTTAKLTQRLRNPKELEYFTINAVAKGRNFGEIFLTRHMNKQLISPDGSIPEFRSIISMLVNILSQIFYVNHSYSNSYIVGCHFDPNVLIQDNMDCKKVSDHYVAANGIATNLEKNQVYVVDYLAKELLINRIANKDGDLELVKRVKMLHSGDNVKYNAEKNVLNIGTIRSLAEAGAKQNDKSMKLTGGLTEFDLDTLTLADEKFAVNLPEAGVFSVADTYKDLILLGCFNGRGILVCKI